MAFYIAAGTMLGLVQMALGIAIGLWIRRAQRGGGDGGELNAARASELMCQLAALASGITKDVQGHRAKISQINDRLTESRSAPESLTDIVVGVVGEVLRANRDLQQRLSSAEAQLQQQSQEIASYVTRAMTDELTGLPNRRAFDDLLRRRLEGFVRHHVPFSLMLIDVDYFKSVNDTYGHIAGDQVLCAIAKVLRSAMRKPDIVARYGGEEFAALLPCTSLEESTHAARHAREAVQAAVTRFEGTPIQVTASVGLTSVQQHDDATAIMKRADDALYASKTGGRNCGHLHDGVQCLRIEETGQQDTAEKVSECSPETDFDTLSDAASAELVAACNELHDFAAAQH